MSRHGAEDAARAGAFCAATQPLGTAQRFPTQVFKTPLDRAVSHRISRDIAKDIVEFGNLPQPMTALPESKSVTRNSNQDMARRYANS